MLEGNWRSPVHDVRHGGENPAVFFATCARLLPGDVRVTVQQTLPGNLSAEDWSLMIEGIKATGRKLQAARSSAPVCARKIAR